MANKKITVKFLRPCKGFAYAPSAVVEIDEDRAAPFIEMGYMVSMGATVSEKAIPEKPKRGRPRKND